MLEPHHALSGDIPLEKRREDAHESAQQWTCRKRCGKRPRDVFDGSAASRLAAQCRSQFRVPNHELLDEHREQNGFAALEVAIHVRLRHLRAPRKLIDTEIVHVRDLEQQQLCGIKQVAPALLLLFVRPRS
jgi:hypothetical protein